jgi:hypothetical protein
MIAALVLSLSLSQLTPEQLLKVNRDRNQANRDGMIVLTTWASLNIATGIAGWATADDPEWRAIHQANFVWNLVNLGLAINGIIQSSADVRGLDLAASREASRSLQLTYLINGGIDFVYITAGAILLWQGNVHESPMLRGWGKSLLLQGAFLVLFDFAMFFVHSTLGAPLRAGTSSAF